MKGLLKRWLNSPPVESAEFITDDRGNKFWLIWADDDGYGPRVDLYFRGRFAGYAEAVLQDDQSLVLANLIVFRKEHRGRGLGKAMLQRFVRYCRDKEFTLLWGWIQPQDGTTEEQLVHLYRQQGFDVFRVEKGHYQIELQL